jgi:pimeloyl-ACP methyl ester carboxylesterase
LDRPIIGGHSMGADASMNLAAVHPDMTRGIFLEDPPIILPGEKFEDGKQEINAEDIGKMMAKFMRIFKLLPKFIGIRLARKANPTYPDDEIIPWIDSKKRLSFDFLNSMGSMKLDCFSSEIRKKCRLCQGKLLNRLQALTKRSRLSTWKMPVMIFAAPGLMVICWL